MILAQEVQLDLRANKVFKGYKVLLEKEGQRETKVNLGRLEPKETKEILVLE